jgi:hypothetical protein
MCKGVRSVIGAVFLFYVLRLQKSLREARYCAKRSAGGASEARLREGVQGADLQAPWLPEAIFF